MSEHGPVYGVELITDLPLDGGMRQAMPSRRDLLQVRDINERTAAGYEVLLEHYRRALEACRLADDALDMACDNASDQDAFNRWMEAKEQAQESLRAVLAKGAAQ